MRLMVMTGLVLATTATTHAQVAQRIAIPCAVQYGASNWGPGSTTVTLTAGARDLPAGSQVILTLRKSAQQMVASKSNEPRSATVALKQPLSNGQTATFDFGGHYIGCGAVATLTVGGRGGAVMTMPDKIPGPVPTRRPLPKAP